MLLELIPISTLLTLLTTQIIETAVAAHDVLVEKETLRLLTNFFMDIQPLLSELTKRNLRDSPAARQALESLQNDVKRARGLVDLCTLRSRIYLLLHCRSIIKEAEQISCDAAKSLALLSLAISEVAEDVRDNVDKLRLRMLDVEFQTSERKLRIVEKIETDLRQRRSDEVAMNNLIMDIAAAVGLPSGDAERKKVLESLQMEVEEASANKQQEEAFYMEQILTLLSVPTPTQVSFKDRSFETGFEEEEPPLPSFFCPFTKAVMEEPVMIATGNTFEHSWIQRWFDSGETIDPISRLPLPNLTLRPNVQLKKIIEEWREHNHRVQIGKAGRNLESDETTLIEEAVQDLLGFCDEIPQARMWIEKEQLIARIVPLLRHQDKDLRKKALSLLQALVSRSDILKEQLVNAGGVQNIVRCLERENLSKMALGLLLQLLQAGPFDTPHKNTAVCNKLTHTKGAIFLLVTVLHGKDTEAAHLAKEILEQLCDEDQSIIAMAKANWFTPLIRRLNHGSEESILHMANALADMELTELNKQNLGEGGAVGLLVRFIPGKLEIKAAVLKVLESLSSIENNKRYVAEAGAVPLFFQVLFSANNPQTVRESAAAILDNLVMSDGRKFLMDANKIAIDLRKTIPRLIALQVELSNALSIRKHVFSLLRALVAAPDAVELRTILKDAGGVLILIPLLEDPNNEIRLVVLELLSNLSEDSAQDICLFLLQRKLGGLFATWLQDTTRSNAQVPAAEILANLPAENSGLTSYLIQEGVLTGLLNVLCNNGSMKLKENAIGALIRFTVPSDVGLQQKVVELGVFPILRNLMKVGTPLAKQRAAIILGNLSKSTLHLSSVPSSVGCFFLLKKPQAVCRVHSGFCRERTTFCLVESKTISDIVLLLREPKSDAASAGVDTLSTLICEDEILEKGANLLHEQEAILAIVTLLSQGTHKSKERAICVLERLFQVKRIKDVYSSRVRMPLVDLAVKGNHQAAKVLAQLEAVLEFKPCHLYQMTSVLPSSKGYEDRNEVLQLPKAKMRLQNIKQKCNIRKRQRSLFYKQFWYFLD
ncbi:hypothetical protein GOP47_0001931 [Adiantum capillus-veneris]|uniref:RING-type E3 ubiquitin transferase n=1 Tax=Adiantum capillus-veneris TaxID=13818 RepID=A0A9D4VAP5_ADICA|nr:hypothetical protein GOP47_0001931 [Adiantum capillus-veneris]